VKFAEYVITGWVITAATLAGYWFWIVRRTKRAEQSLPDGEVE
jgi:Heme exporter protein D (CcmD)